MEVCINMKIFPPRHNTFGRDVHTHLKYEMKFNLKRSHKGNSSGNNPGILVSLFYIVSKPAVVQETIPRRSFSFYVPVIIMTVVGWWYGEGRKERSSDPKNVGRKQKVKEKM